MSRGCDICGQPATRVSVSGHCCDRHWPDIDAFARQVKMAEDSKVSEIRRTYRLPFGALLIIRRAPLRIELLFPATEDQFQQERQAAKLKRQRARSAS